MKLKLRTYSPGDFETLYEIDRVCYEPSIAYSREELGEYLQFPGADCLVAEIEPGRTVPAPSGGGRHLPQSIFGNVAGFCLSAHKKDRGYIITIDVLEAHRRHGVGTALLAEIELRLAARNVSRVGLETATDNESAIAFWQKHGYRKRGIKKGYYPGGRHAFSMAKRIGSGDVTDVDPPSKR